MYLAACPTFRKDLWLQPCSCLLGLHGAAGCVSCPRVSCGSCHQSGMQGDTAGMGSRRTGCWDGSSKTKLWTPLIIGGEESTYPEPGSSCPCARAKRSGKTPFKCLFLSELQREPSCLTKRRDVKSPGIRWYQSHHTLRNQGNFTQRFDIWHLCVDTIMCEDTCMCNIMSVSMRNCHP